MSRLKRHTVNYEIQRRYYTEKIQSEPKWQLVEIFADRGITGTSTKKRDEFNRMIRMCKRGKIDMIITKSISRFARNTLDCLEYVRMLKELNVDVFFEEQGIHSNQAGAEFYITIYGSIVQSESENISANVKWGKAQSAKEGNVTFQYDKMLGYRKGEDGTPEIVPKEAEIIRKIYTRFLAGDSMATIATANEKHRLEDELTRYADTKQKRENAKSRLDEIFTVIDTLKNHPLTYDDKIVRQIIECVVVESAEKIKVVFIGGMEVEQELI